MDHQRLQGRVAIVTGSAQGIGAVYAKALAAQGARVTACDLVDTRQVVEEINAKGGQALGHTCDVTDADAVRSTVAASVAAFGKVDILVTNAALFTSLSLKRFTEIDSAEFDRVMAVNVRGVFECIKAVTPQMQARGYGKIVNISSGTVFRGTPMLLHYVTSKAAIVGMTRCLARELGDFGIRVNTLAPGLTMSDGVRNHPQWARSVIESNTATRSIRREQIPEDLEGALVFLCSAESDFMTGQCLVVDGGSMMH